MAIWEIKNGYDKLDRQGVLREFYETVTGKKVGSIVNVKENEVIKDVKLGYEKIRFNGHTDIHIYRSKTVPELVLGKRDKRERLSDIVKQYLNVKVAINGQLFAYDGSENDGYGLIITDDGKNKEIKDFYQGSSPNFVDMIANKDGTVKFEVVKDYKNDIKRLIGFQKNAHWACGTSYILKDNGKDSKLNWDKFSHVNTYTNRTMIGTDTNGIWYFVVADCDVGKHDKGLRAIDQVQLCNQLGLINAANLDGGGSSDLWLDGKNIVSGNFYDERAIGTTFIIR